VKPASVASKFLQWLAMAAGPVGVWSAGGVLVLFVWLFDRASRGFIREGGPDWASLQLAFDAGTFRHVLMLWAAASPEHDAMAAARATLWQLDLLFPIAYAVFLSAAYWWFLNTADVPLPPPGAQPVIPRVSPPLSRLLLAWIAAGFDLVENALLFGLIPASDADLPAATFSGTLVWTAGLAAALKWTFVILAALASVHALFTGPRGIVLRLSRYSLLSLALGSLPLALSDQGLDLVTSLAESEGMFDFARLLTVVWLWAASVWYWSRVVLDAAGDGSQSWTYVAWARWTPRVLGALTLAAPTLAFLRAVGRPQAMPGSVSPAAMAWMCILSAVLFLGLTVFRRSMLLGPEAPRGGFALARLPRATLTILAASLAVSLAAFAFMVGWPVEAGAFLGAPAILVIAAANTVFFGNLAVFVGRAWRLPFDALAFCCAAGFSLWNDNHPVRPIGSELATTRPPATAAFAQWAARHPDGPVIVVAAEGGGIRAAYWTMAVLARVHAEIPEARTRLFAVSGISGGSVGGALYAALVRDGRDVARESGPVLADGLLAPVLAKMVTGDFLQWLLPLPVPAFDRSLGFEQALASAYDGGRDAGSSTFERGFLELRPDPAAGVPALYLTSVSVETGARVIASPYAWPDDGSRRDRVDLHELIGADLSLASAVHNSARFTYVSPAGRLIAHDGEDRGHVVDGGYFENTGIETAIDVMDAVDPAGAREFILLVLCNTPGGCRRPEAAVEPAAQTMRVAPAAQAPEMTSWRQRQSLGEVLAPVRALLATRDMRGRLARARIDRRARAIEFGICPVGDQMLVDAPLGWQLSAGARRTLDEQVRACTAAPLAALARVLGR
jgi:hypothetical protein